MWIGFVGYWNVVLGGLAIAVAGALVIWCGLMLPYRRLKGITFSGGEVCEEVIFLFFGTLLGISIGVIQGISRQPAVGAVVPAVLTFIGALVGYIYSSSTTANRFIILLAALSLIIFFYWGTFIGATLRGPWEDSLRFLELSKLQYAASIEKDRMQYDAELKRQARVHQAELDVWVAKQKPRIPNPSRP